MVEIHESEVRRAPPIAEAAATMEKRMYHRQQMLRLECVTCQRHAMQGRCKMFFMLPARSKTQHRNQVAEPKHAPASTACVLEIVMALMIRSLREQVDGQV